MDRRHHDGLDLDRLHLCACACGGIEVFVLMLKKGSQVRTHTDGLDSSGGDDLRLDLDGLNLCQFVLFL